MNDNQFDVIILGGGVIGLNIAYELSKEKLNIAVVDARQFGSGASGASAAMLELQIDAHRGEPFFSFAKKSHDLYPLLYSELKNLTGIDFEFSRCGIYQLALTEAEGQKLKSEVEFQRSCQLQATFYETKELSKRHPYLNPKNFGAIFYEEDGKVNGEKLILALTKALELKNVTFFQNTSPVIIDSNSNEVELTNSKEKLKAKKIIVSAGAWAQALLSPLNANVAVFPVRGQLLTYETPSDFPNSPIYTERNGYITPQEDGTALVGTTVEHVGFDESTTIAGIRRIEELGQNLIPYFKGKKFLSISAALRPGSEDGLPFLGPLETSPNIIVATGHYRNGILLAPITAKVVSELILARESTQDLTPFNPTRTLVSPPR